MLLHFSIPLTILWYLVSESVCVRFRSHRICQWDFDLEWIIQPASFSCSINIARCISTHTRFASLSFFYKFSPAFHFDIFISPLKHIVQQKLHASGSLVNQFTSNSISFQPCIIFAFESLCINIGIFVLSFYSDTRMKAVFISVFCNLLLVYYVFHLVTFVCKGFERIKIMWLLQFSVSVCISFIESKSHS